MAPHDIPDPHDKEHDLADELGRWLEVAVLKEKYPTY